MAGLGSLPVVRCLMLAAAFALVVERPIQAQPIPFPPAAASPAAAAAGFEARATAVIAANACSREDDYLRIRTEMAAGNFDSQGEDLTGILIGKVAYIRAQAEAHSNAPCAGVIVRPRARNAEGGFVHATLQQFADADRALRAAGPTACARETNETKRLHEPNTLTDAEKTQLSEMDQLDEISIDLVVAPDCMVRQVNEAILAMQKTTQLGSSDLRCLEHLSKSKGEFDVNVRELVRLLYLGGPRGRGQGILAPATIDHMYSALLAARGGPSDDSYSVIAGCGEPAGDELGSPEDTADRHAWYNELADGIGDFFAWLAVTFFRVVGSAVSTAAGLVAAPFLIAAGEDPTELILPHTDIRVRETENHRLMIETSRFLTNADIIARLEAEGYYHVDDIRDDQAEVRSWLLRRLQDIAAHDFQEYNSRPYTRYSLNAVLNLHDFAAAHGDAAMATAARIVLDLSEAKFAATSNRGRRAAPFRRRSEYDGYDPAPENSGPADLYNIVRGGDHEVARAMLLAGQTQLLNGGPSREAMAQMVNAATSPYRLPSPVLATAIERRASMQTIRHTGIEQVVQSPAFTISAGGVRTGPTATLSGFSEGVDRGVAMPTTIIPTVAAWRIADLFRFDGVGGQHERAPNTCVAEGFACGIQPNLSAAFENCTKGEVLPGEGLWFVSSAGCLPAIPGPHFYLAARIVDCPDSFCVHGRQWGVMDVVEASPPPPIQDGEVLRAAPDPAFNQFQAERRAPLEALNPDANGDASYVTAAGRRIDFNLDEAGPRIRAVDDVAPPAWTTAGDAIDADGAGRAVLKGPGGPVTIDFSDWSNPKRTP